MSEVKKSLTVVGAATKGLGTQTAAILKVVDQLSAIANVVPAMVDEIELKQGELNAIEEQTKLAVRTAKVELDLQVKENEAKVLADLMKKAGYAVITTTELAVLNTKLNTAEAFNQEEITKAVKIAESRKDAEHKVVLASKESEHAVASAKATADLEAAQTKINFLERQVTSLEGTITAEREARVQEAQARAQAQGVTINHAK